MAAFLAGVPAIARPRQARCLQLVCSLRGADGGKVVVGLNQYSHDASVAVVDGASGELLFAAAKERLTRQKHDGGDTGELVLSALHSCGLDIDDIASIVTNNHHFRVLPFEERLPFAAAIGAVPRIYLDDPLLREPMRALKTEISHHLAHAWSVLPLCPFDSGLIVVMDGMGEHWREFGQNDPKYTTDLALPRHQLFAEYPAVKEPSVGYREAETVYSFDGLKLSLVYKRWTRERSPPELYNHGFENMESLGAVYSRVSSHIFGDWNTCGKVMGLAPYFDKGADANTLPRLLHGQLFDGTVSVDAGALSALPWPNQWDSKEHHGFYTELAHRVQTDVEEQVLEFLGDLRRSTGARNLCLAGGVALNSTINGEVIRSAGFDRVYVPPYPGDEGISVGCAMFGALEGGNDEAPRPKARHMQPTPYLGARASEDDIEFALEEPEFAPYVNVTRGPGGHCGAVQAAIDVLATGGVVAWYQGRSELGPRALGNRSMLADPRAAASADRLNRRIKRRELFRPFAPAVLAERATEYFELDGRDANASPYMSMTAVVREHVRETIPAVTHVDGTARLQTVTRDANPLFHDLISQFGEATGVPVLLNTSLNVAGEPIVESPEDALRMFLSTEIDLLVVEDYIVRKREAPPALEASWAVELNCRILRIEQVDTTYDETGQYVLHLMDGRVVLGSRLELAIARKLWDHEDDTEFVAVGSIREYFRSLQPPLLPRGAVGTEGDGLVDRALMALYRRRVVHFPDLLDGLQPPPIPASDGGTAGRRRPRP